MTNAAVRGGCVAHYLLVEKIAGTISVPAIFSTSRRVKPMRNTKRVIAEPAMKSNAICGQYFLSRRFWGRDNILHVLTFY